MLTTNYTGIYTLTIANALNCNPCLSKRTPCQLACSRSLLLIHTSTNDRDTLRFEFPSATPAPRLPNPLHLHPHASPRNLSLHGRRPRLTATMRLSADTTELKYSSANLTANGDPFSLPLCELSYYRQTQELPLLKSGIGGLSTAAVAGIAVGVGAVAAVGLA
ncbi:hypothetical protein HDU96_011105, partial [Phlyctochytrium bullatum]